MVRERGDRRNVYGRSPPGIAATTRVSLMATTRWCHDATWLGASPLLDGTFAGWGDATGFIYPNPEAP